MSLIAHLLTIGLIVGACIAGVALAAAQYRNSRLLFWSVSGIVLVVVAGAFAWPHLAALVLWLLPWLGLAALGAGLALLFGSNRLLFWCLTAAVAVLAVLYVTTAHPPAIIVAVVPWLVGLVLVGALAALYRGNRRLFWCLLGAIICVVVAQRILVLVPRSLPEIAALAVLVGMAALYFGNIRLFWSLLAALALAGLCATIVMLAPRSLPLLVTLAAVVGLVALYRTNQRLFWYFGGTSAGVVLSCLLLMFLASRPLQPELLVSRVRVSLAKSPTPPPPKVPKKVEKPRPKIVPLPRKPLVQQKPAVKPKGVTKPKTPNKKAGSKQHPKNHKTVAKQYAKAVVSHKLTSTTNSPNGTVVTGNDEVDPLSQDLLSNGSGIGIKDIGKEDKPAGGDFDGSGHGLGNGDEDGEQQGDPESRAIAGTGKVRGRAVYIRLKYDKGAWNANVDGTNRMLDYLSNNGFKCESAGRALTAAQLKDKYLSKRLAPTFIYIYADADLSFTSSEINILRQYMEAGGFLFIDSRHSDEVRAAVKRELNRILPGSSLQVLSKSNPIYNTLFRLKSGGPGEDYVDQRDYGVTRNGRLVVFFTRGNLSHFYSMQAPDNDYAKATYQMGANVMVYAMYHGDTDGIGKKAGASGKVTAKILEQLGVLDGARPGNVPGKPKPSVKEKPKAGEEDLPEDIKVLD